MDIRTILFGIAIVGYVLGGILIFAVRAYEDNPSHSSIAELIAYFVFAISLIITFVLMIFGWVSK